MRNTAEIQNVVPLPRRMIPIKRVSGITGLAVSTLYAKLARNEFPQGKKLSKGKGGARRWDEAEIVAWIDEVGS